MGETWYSRRVRPGAEDQCQSAQLDNVIEHDPAWLFAQCDSGDKHILALTDGEDRLIPLFVHKGRLSFSIGELTIGSLSVLRHVLVGNFTGISRNSWLEAIQALCNGLTARSAVFLLGVVDGEELDAALLSPELQNRLLVLQQGPVYQRRMCKLGTSLEEYLQGLSSKSRQDVKRSLRRFQNEYQGRFSLSVYSSASEVATFLDTVEPVSRRTYQGKLLGLAIDKKGHIGHKALQGAKLGYTLCLLLTVDDKPIAWRIGFLYQNVFYSHHIGFEPELRRFHPGVVMHLETIRYLSESHPEIDILDMLYGDNDFKRKVGNSTRQERNIYLFQKNLYGRFAWVLLRSCNFVSQKAGAALEYLGLKNTLRAVIRKIAAS
ncbi:GNAT family N-acetyltransferase [Kineobactrum sediminis]|uniref:GNAT family N-acetyltransferase n=1 Tax=Kineobactrum sediminis TaxID=1905677 RepID=A0A2N5XZF4_9GAMM|nr:GNAT family N-acetyltransferase [Kineobactrum sediminis]PLW81524.1 GNAT family N-acetyltransferase [Kineobactrum sediminis]